VNDGTKRANDTANSLGQIVTNVVRVAEVVDRIFIASKHQAESIEHINTGITLISNVVQSNSATSQQSAASAEELNSQAHTLKQLIEFFRIK
jgi:methyl-accepting chemotaxis protein